MTGFEWPKSAPIKGKLAPPLASWLAAHRLSDGLAGYWLADRTTVDTRGRVVVSAVTLGHGGQLVPYQWETDDANYDPSRHDANFVVTDGPGSPPGRS